MTVVFRPQGVGGASAFQHPDFRLFQLSRFLSTVGFQMQGVAVGWQVYSLTRRPMDLGYVGLAQFLPAIGLSLLAGHVADRFDRKRVLIVCYSTLALGALALFGLSQLERPSVYPIYAVLTLVGAARAFAGPAGSALMPNLVPMEHFSNAVAWSSSIWHVAVVVGPALGGMLYGAAGASFVYLAVTLIQLATASLFARIPRRLVTRPNPDSGFGELLAGVRYVWGNRVILGALSLDLFAVLFGGAIALLPVYARDILRVGPTGLGLLRSAPAVGAIAVGVLLAYRPLRRNVGAVMFACVGVFGVATVVFGLSRTFTLSLTALCIAGAADMVSVFVRHTLVQLNTPDQMRGRVSAVNMVFIGASNELGEFESGLAAAWLGTVPAVVLGGVGTCAVVVLWSVLFPELRSVKRLEVEAV